MEVEGPDQGLAPEHTDLSRLVKKRETGPGLLLF